MKDKPNIRVLLIDDEETLLEYLSKRLLKKGFTVKVAVSGEEALGAAKEEQFDVAVVDLKMPGIDGVELTEAVTTLSPSTIVVWVTAYGSPEAIAEAQRLGVYRCVDKPLEVGEIRQIAREALRECRDQAPSVE